MARKKEVTHGHKVDDIFFRVFDRLVSAGVDEFDEPVGPAQVQVHVCEYRVTRVTPCGVWIDGHRFVLLNAVRRYAHPTVEAAIDSFKHRKRKQMTILKARLRHAEKAVVLIDQLNYTPRPRAVQEW